MSPDSSAVIGQFGIRGERLVEGAHPGAVGTIYGGNAAKPEHVEAARKRWHEIAERDLARRGDQYWVDLASGLLYMESPGSPLLADGMGSTVLFSVIGGSTLMFLRRPESGPTSVDELDKAEAAEVARELAAEKARLTAREKGPRTAVWFGQGRGVGPFSLRDVVRDFEESGGRVELGPDGRLVITAPERLSGADSFQAAGEVDLRKQIGRQAELIVHCRELVEETLRSRNGAKVPLHELLPEGCATLVGRVA